MLDLGRVRLDAGYRQAVLEALQEAKTALSRFGSARAQLGQLTRAEATASRAATLNRQQFDAATTSLID